MRESHREGNRIVRIVPMALSPSWRMTRLPKVVKQGPDVQIRGCRIGDLPLPSRRKCLGCAYDGTFCPGVRYER